MKSEKIVLNEMFYSSVKWSKIIKRGQTIQLKTKGDNASLSAMFFNASNYAERFNSADTVKIQWNAFLGKEKCLFSEMGRVLFAITDDTTDGLFDAFAGISNARIVKENFTGDATFESCRNGYFKSDRENFLIELGKYGMGKKDMHPALNLFRKVDVRDGSKLVLNERCAKDGDVIELTAHMNVLLVLSNTPHVMDKGEYNPSDIEITIFDAVEFKDEDYESYSKEAKRGFQNTNRYFA
jgi:urea carboxylase-associated protein 2